MVSMAEFLHTESQKTNSNLTFTRIGFLIFRLQTLHNMKSTVGIYDNQEAALAAVKHLKSEGFPANKISLLSQAAEDVEKLEEIEEDDEKVYNKPMKIAATGLGVGAIVGPIVGALAGVGLLAIPGLGILVGAGALAGAVAGLDVGIIGGGLLSALAIAGTSKSHEDKYQEVLKKGKTLVILQGTQDEMVKANEILSSYGSHDELVIH